MTQFNLASSISNFLKYQQNINSCSAHTIRAYKLDLEQSFGCQISVKEADLLPLIRAAQMKWGSLSLATRNRKAATLKSFFNYLFETKIIEQDLALKIRCPKVQSKIPNFISVDEVLSVIQYLETQRETNPVLLPLFYVTYGAGLRVSELCQLKWSDVNFEKRSLKILGKGSKERFAILPTKCATELQKWKSQCRSNFVFENPKTSLPINTRTAYQMIRDMGSASGLMHPLHPHALRHSFATHLLSSGANLRTLQELLGHESLKATEKYTHLSMNDLARTMEQTHPLGEKKSVSAR